MTANLTPAMRRALKRAASRERGTLFPIPGVWAAAGDTLYDALARRGMVEGYPVPVITDAGRAAIA